MDLERGHDLCQLMMGKLETIRKLMKSNQCLGISEPCTDTKYTPLPLLHFMPWST
jgi:hypothetical protein